MPTFASFEKVDNKGKTFHKAGSSHHVGDNMFRKLKDRGYLTRLREFNRKCHYPPTEHGKDRDGNHAGG